MDYCGIVDSPMCEVVSMAWKALGSRGEGFGQLEMMENGALGFRV
jgi:hypothetical protein